MAGLSRGQPEEVGIFSEYLDLSRFPVAQYGDDLVRYLRAQLDGSAYLQACLASHLPVDLVVIMLGSNDLKPVFNRTPLRIAMGAARLIDLVNTLNGGVGTSYKNPKVLLICPPALDPKIEKGPVFAEMFKGGLEKSKQLPPLYEAVAKMGGAEFLNACEECEPSDSVRQDEHFAGISFSF